MWDSSPVSVFSHRRRAQWGRGRAAVDNVEWWAAVDDAIPQRFSFSVLTWNYFHFRYRVEFKTEVFVVSRRQVRSLLFAISATPGGRTGDGRWWICRLRDFSFWLMNPICEFFHRTEQLDYLLFLFIYYRSSIRTLYRKTLFLFNSYQRWK